MTTNASGFCRKEDTYALRSGLDCLVLLPSPGAPHGRASALVVKPGNVEHVVAPVTKQRPAVPAVPPAPWQRPRHLQKPSPVRIPVESCVLQCADGSNLQEIAESSPTGAAICAHALAIQNAMQYSCLNRIPQTHRRFESASPADGIVPYVDRKRFDAQHNVPGSSSSSDCPSCDNIDVHTSDTCSTSSMGFGATELPAPPLVPLGWAMPGRGDVSDGSLDTFLRPASRTHSQYTSSLVGLGNFEDDSSEQVCGRAKSERQPSNCEIHLASDDATVVVGRAPVIFNGDRTGQTEKRQSKFFAKIKAVVYNMVSADTEFQYLTHD